MATTPSPLPHDPGKPPAYEWRGLLVDSAHAFLPVSTMELLLSVMARYRLNILHWCLTDDTGWRMPVPGFPLLTSVGNRPAHENRRPRQDDAATQLPGQRRPRPPLSGRGFYSDANIRRLVSYASARGIRIVPEISVPSRAGAAIRSYPHLGNPRLAASTDASANTTLWPHASSVSFVEAALHRACDLFPSPIIHIGAGHGDWGPWEADASLMRAGLPLGSDVERLFVERALRALRLRGRRAAAWDSLTRSFPTPPGGMVLLSQRPGGVGQEAVEKSGTPWVLADEDPLSLSAPSGAAASGCTTADARRLYERLPRAVGARRLAGLEAAAWSPSPASPELLIRRLLPRLLVVAEVAWHGGDALPWERLSPLIEREAAHLGRTIPSWNNQRA